MNNIEELLETAHISISTVTLTVVVDSLDPYRPLFSPRSKQVAPGLFEIDSTWRDEMNFPSFVMDIGPWHDDGTLRVFALWPVDLKILSDWLKTFENKLWQSLPGGREN